MFSGIFIFSFITAKVISYALCCDSFSARANMWVRSVIISSIAFLLLKIISEILKVTIIGFPLFLRRKSL
jgi:hypothetical protein